jgi:hypothetical protein
MVKDDEISYHKKYDSTRLPLYNYLSYIHLLHDASLSSYLSEKDRKWQLTHLTISLVEETFVW